MTGRIPLQDVGGGGGTVQPQLITPTAVQKDYDPAPEQEKARANIAYILLAALVGMAVFLVGAAAILAGDCADRGDCAHAKETAEVVTGLVNLAFTPIVGLVGSVIGFYFGTKAASGK